MVKASALYIVIIIALVIGLLCSSLLTTAYFYRLQYQRTFRYDHLQNNVSSGVNILLAAQGNYTERTFSLFNGDADSVTLKKTQWGIYDIGISKAFTQGDTLYKVFSIANAIDSLKWTALYIIDEDRPISVSGKTLIRGDAYLPKAGVKQVYVDGKAYDGPKKLIDGDIHNSEKKLPGLLTARLDILRQSIEQKHTIDSSLLKYDTVTNSFLSPTRIAYMGEHETTIANISLNGNIIIFSDTSVVIENTARLNNVIIFAKSITVKKGFSGSCQLFASEVLDIEQDCNFEHPSCLGAVRFTTSDIKKPLAINLGDNTVMNGLIFTYEKEKSELQPLIDLGKNIKIEGQIYSQGIIGLKDGVTINGSVFTSRFLYQSQVTRFENYIINTKIDSKSLSRYYLSSELAPVVSKKKKVLQWLETN